MNVLTAISPGLKVLFERVGKPEIVNRPDLFRFGGAGAVIACNHVGWADSLWMAYAVYPRQLRYMSKEELFGSTLSRWVLTHGGSVPIDRADPSPSSIKTAVDMLQRGEIILIFPSGTRSEENIAFKRGTATIALHARVPLVPAFFQGPKQMQIAHLLLGQKKAVAIAVRSISGRRRWSKLQKWLRPGRPLSRQIGMAG